MPIHPDQPSVVNRQPGQRVGPQGAQAGEENLAVEAPCEIRLGGRSHVLLMATPRDLEHLALGFCLSEALVEEPGQVQAISLGQGELPGVGPVFWADVTLPPELARRARARRSAPAATSCGLCGLESFRDLGCGIRPVQSSLTVELAAIHQLFAAMEARQEIYRRTGATHAVALGTAKGELLHLGEDVGRHNAMDKCLGQALAQGQDLGRCLCAISGRVSMEMALKAARLGVPVVGSVSAATSLGRQICDQAGITLAGFVRGVGATVYCHPQRIMLNGRPLQDSSTQRSC